MWSCLLFYYFEGAFVPAGKKYIRKRDLEMFKWIVILKHVRREVVVGIHCLGETKENLKLVNGTCHCEVKGLKRILVTRDIV